jgi:AcrR family transcriptional regulator
LWSRGLNEVTVEQITDAADVGKGTFFNYFPSKEHAIPEVNDFPRRVLKAVEEARTGSEPVLQVLERIVRTMLWPPSLDASWITFWDNYLEVMITSGDIRALISGQMSTVRHAYTILLTLGQERREIRRDRPAGELAAQLHSVLLGHTLIEWIHRGTLQSPETEAILTLALGTLKPPAPPRRPHAARRPVRATRSRPRAAKGRTRR